MFEDIRILMDFIPNHTSDEHEWFQKSVKREDKYTDYYVWKNALNQNAVLENANIKPIPPNNWVNLIKSYLLPIMIKHAYIIHTLTRYKVVYYKTCSLV